MPVYEEKGRVSVLKDSSITVGFEGFNVRSSIVLYLNGAQIFSTESQEGNEVTFTLNRKTSTLQWIVISTENIPWSYEVVIKANGNEVVRYPDSKEGNVPSLAQCTLVVEDSKIGGDI